MKKTFGTHLLIGKTDKRLPILTGRAFAALVQGLFCVVLFGIVLYLFPVLFSGEAQKEPLRSDTFWFILSASIWGAGFWGSKSDSPLVFGLVCVLLFPWLFRVSVLTDDSSELVRFYGGVAVVWGAWIGLALRKGLRLAVRKASMNVRSKGWFSDLLEETVKMLCLVSPSLVCLWLFSYFIPFTNEVIGGFLLMLGPVIGFCWLRQNKKRPIDNIFLVFFVPLGGLLLSAFIFIVLFFVHPLFAIFVAGLFFTDIGAFTMILGGILSFEILADLVSYLQKLCKKSVQKRRDSVSASI